MSMPLPYSKLDLSQRLKDLRKDRGYNQEKVAVAISIKRPTYASYEEGRAEPSIAVLLSLVHLYNFDSLDQLLGIVSLKPSGTHPVLHAYFNLKSDMRKVVDFILNQNNDGTGDTEH